MPFKSAQPEPILTPLDKTLDGIQNKQPSVALKPAVPPAPQSRIVAVQPGTAFFGLSIGMYDPFTHDEKAAALNLEWQPGVKVAGVLQPLFGAMVTTRGSMLGYGGIGLPLKINDRIKLLPSVSIGAYEEGRGLDLGRTLAFRIGSELAYQFDDKSRIGLNAYVLTNGTSTGREDRTEVLGVAYTLPLKVNAQPAQQPVKHDQLQNPR